VKVKKRLNLEFHPDAAARFNELAHELLNCVGSFGPVQPPKAVPTQLHPVMEIPESDIIELKIQRSSVNLLGEEMGRYWESKGLLVGWEGEEFAQIKELAKRFSVAAPIKGQVSQIFLEDEVFGWLRETLERQRGDSLTDYIARRCSVEIEEQEIWIPVNRTYSAQDFALADVEFRTISKKMMDAWSERLFQSGEIDKGAAMAIQRERSRMQGGLAAHIKVKAERRKAKEIAHSAANEAVALLRFLSPVNWTCRIVSYCLPLGSENILQTVELFVKDGMIANSSKGVIDQGPAGWNIDEARRISPQLLETLQRVASDREGTEFRSDLYATLQLHARNSVVAPVSHKIVFVVAAIESLLLKDPNEPIQKNLGERMAFIIGNSLEQRRPIVTNVEDFYRIRSRLIHHGQEAGPQDMDVIDRFFFNVWWTLRHLVADVDKYKTKEALLSSLEDRKLS
jgi:hypothetical protein